MFRAIGAPMVPRPMKPTIMMPLAWRSSRIAS
jgi:hypothetical protein